MRASTAAKPDVSPTASTTAPSTREACGSIQPILIDRMRGAL
jgi:hypothetical protein